MVRLQNKNRIHSLVFNSFMVACRLSSHADTTTRPTPTTFDLHRKMSSQVIAATIVVVLNILGTRMQRMFWHSSSFLLAIKAVRKFGERLSRSQSWSCVGFGTWITCILTWKVIGRGVLLVLSWYRTRSACPPARPSGHVEARTSLVQRKYDSSSRSSSVLLCNFDTHGTYTPEECTYFNTRRWHAACRNESLI